MIDKFEGDYAFLSNFFYSPITIEGKRYLTVENYFQSMKAANPGNAEEIRLAPTPGKSKRLGRHCVIRKDWEDVKEDIMYKGVKLNLYKIQTCGPRLKKPEMLGLKKEIPGMIIHGAYVIAFGAKILWHITNLEKF